MKRVRTALGSSWRWILQPLLVIGVLIAGFVLARSLGAARQPPERQAQLEHAPLVRTLIARPANHPLVVSGTGTLRARSRVDLISQVGGKLVAVNPELRPGGTFAAGDLLAQVERRDYELALERGEAELSSGEAAVAYEQADVDADLAQWRALRPGQTIPAVVYRAPRLAEAEARVRAARVSIAQAKLDLSRTRLVAEFPGRVVSSEVEQGEVIAAGQTLAALYSTATYEVPVPLEIGEADRLFAAGDDLRVRVHADLGARRIALPGRVARTEGEVDARSRQVRVVVEIPSSGLPEADRRALMPGLFLDVEFEAGRMDGVTRLPAGALRNEGRLLLVEDGRLRLHRPELAWSDGEAVYLRGLPDPAEVVVSTLETATEGMAVRSAAGEPRS